MKPRDYCCCAIPIINAGIYAVLTEQLVLAILTGTLAVATPHLVGAATPMFAPWILAIICYVTAGLQILGFLGVAQGKHIMYRRYVTLHIMTTLGAFSVAAVWIAISASRHSTAQTQCQSDFFSNSTTATTESQTLCNIFPWVNVGLMGGLWLVLAIAQFYFYIVLSSFGKAQREALAKYDSVYDASKPLTNDIPLNDRSDPWNARLSSDSLPDQNGRDLGPSRRDSAASVSTILGDKKQEPQPAFAGPSVYDPESQNYPPPGRQASVNHGPPQPQYAYTQEPGPTPQYSDYYYGGAHEGGMEPPERAQAHPAEGSFHRKTPRRASASGDFDS
ncbi:hypothetical protein JAAARDRAFT_29696 [Jaapia argillacea MUCL 33604]|uniref:Uncharacterized protein n=1 Tax=Jaapia argillacea MUCL 33604 TaxID=933084 RepID=A0A067QLZ9_9AGAM|nr:hypothetical protein JAAARDRAFT_29696 [Jaapia argillacea MUCL 33604]